MATTPKNEVQLNIFVKKEYNLPVELGGSVFFNSTTIIPMLKGWATNPTARSETARLRSSAFRGFGSDKVFLMAWIVKMFNMMAV